MSDDMLFFYTGEERLNDLLPCPSSNLAPLLVVFAGCSTARTDGFHAGAFDCSASRPSLLQRNIQNCLDPIFADLRHLPQGDLASV